MKRGVVLLLDARDRETALLGVVQDGTLTHVRSIPIFGATHRILATVRSLVKPSDICGIVVAAGPGSFTAIRMGVVVANALAFGLNVPLAGVRLPLDLPPSRESLGSLARVRPRTRGLVQPVYTRPPSITKRRK